ncbi:MAG TPA: cisplatin damage response ATP-dependent DNA ligase [Beijerinckiaceae bacterium]|nr:cisplatin damage response ATP-dependent DNA ligase [Beijerinckiaceae bacterium]
MNRFAGLLDRLAYEPGRNNKIRLMIEYFRTEGDPDRGYGLAAMTGALSFSSAKPALVRALIAERVDPALFAMSYDYVGDLSETVALLWPAPPREDAAPAASNRPAAPSLSDVVETLRASSKLDLPRHLTNWLDELDETGRWALLKLITGGLRIGVSARLAKTAIAEIGGVSPDEIEEVWHGLAPPYLDLFAWIEGRSGRPETRDPAPFRTPMLAHPLVDKDFAALSPADFSAEWKWDGVRIQAVAGRDSDGRATRRLFSRTGEDVSRAFPDIIETLDDPRFGDSALDGELLVMRENRVQPFSILQQRLNRKTVSAKLLTDYPVHIRAYDLLVADGQDQRALPFCERRKRLEAFVTRLASARVDLSPLVRFSDWSALAQARRDPAGAGAGPDAEAIEGIMLKRTDSAYLPGRPKGLWWKWKRDPFNIDAVLMYAQRGHGKRSSFYSDFTFGVWRAGESGDELVPVGKAYFGFTDEELTQLDRWVRNHTSKRFGPVREVVHGEAEGVVLEIAFEGLNRSTRHKSGVAMRFPRIARIRWDKPAREADRLDSLEALLGVRSGSSAQ